MIQNNLNWWEHVTKIVKKAGKRLYMLSDTKALSTVYITVIRPLLEYACQVWHFNIPEYLSDDIERVQKRALRIILPELCYADATKFINIPLLKERRESLCERFFLKHENLKQLMNSYPINPPLHMIFWIKCRYNNYFCKTERFRKSFYRKLFRN